jgi:hypothetical protein
LHRVQFALAAALHHVAGRPTPTFEWKVLEHLDARLPELGIE